MNTRATTWARTVMAGAGAVALIGATAPRERMIAVDGAVLPTTLDGAKGTLIVDPGATSMPMLSADFATRAGLKGGMFGMRYAVGPVVVPGSSAVARIDLGQGPEKRRVAWAKPPMIAGADGVVGPGGLPEPIVRFVLRPPLAGERTVALRMVDGGGLMGGWAGLFGEIDVDGGPVRVRFDLHHAPTMVNAGTATMLARTNAGTLAPDARTMEVAFGIERPVRTMTLATPLAIGPLALTTMAVRTRDFGNAEGIAEAAPDPDEIVVTAKGKRDRRRDRIAIGTDALARCSSIVFDKPAKLVRLTCA